VKHSSSQFGAADDSNGSSRTLDYEPVTRSRFSSITEDITIAEDAAPAGSKRAGSVSGTVSEQESFQSTSGRARLTRGKKSADAPLIEPQPRGWLTGRGHAVTYLGLFLFTAIVYFRPYEWSTSLEFLSSAAWWVALFTLLVYIPSQLTLENNLTARPREINLVLLLCLAALLSMIKPINRLEAWEKFSGEFLKVVLMFIIMVNVVRTSRRLKGLIFLAFAVSVVLSIGALNDFRQGILALHGLRIAGAIGGMFGNPNDLAMHLVTMIPLAVALSFATRNPLTKLAYIVCVTLMAAGVVVTFSRGGFLGLAVGATVLAWKISRQNRVAIIALIFVAVVAFFIFAPGEYAGRLASIYNMSDGSASSRRALLIKSLITTAANPIFGVGFANFHHVSIREQESHNAYTQVSAEMGLAAMVVYILFLITPIWRLRRIERETSGRREERGVHYMAVGIQASLIAFMVSSFFGSVAYQWYAYYLVGYAVCLRRMYEAREQKAENSKQLSSKSLDGDADEWPLPDVRRDELRNKNNFDPLTGR
jgi:putative inorganic carbon (hco3(-)) transporter